ncbi:fungal-specific transcription factor domain-containing protein [Schizophyllum fasciatum]
MAPASKEKEKEKEQRPRKKPGRVPTSCAECRRLKLKCDKGIPCQKCVSRGCGSICPDGQLVSGKGNRFFLANTEELHAEIEQLRARNRELEQALHAVQGGVTSSPQPTTGDPTYSSASAASAAYPTPPDGAHAGPSGSQGRSSPGLESMQGIQMPTIVRPEHDEESLLDAFGTLTLDGNGAARFLGNTARPEYLARVQWSYRPKEPDRIFPMFFGNRTLGSRSYENELTCQSHSEAAREIIRLLPSLSEAVRLAEIYLSYGDWLFSSMNHADLFDDIIQDVFRADHAQVPETWYHKLAVAFSVFAIASLFDPTLEAFSSKARDYFNASRTALSLLAPYRATTLACIQAILHLLEYMEMSDSDAVGPPEVWIYDGVGLRLCQSIGLHLDSARWNLDPVLASKRRDLFWAMYAHDTWQSFWFGRPPMFDDRFIDCPLPTETRPPSANGEQEMSFRLWILNYARLLHHVMTTAFNARPPPYATIIELDRRIRDFVVPEYLRPVCSDSVPCNPETTAATPAQSMQRWLVLIQKESTLLNLHRAYFAVALDERPMELSSHRYVPSVLATYRSAWRLGKSLQLIWSRHPECIARVGLMWSQGLSAAIVMCLVVTRAPTASMAPSAFDELGLLADMFAKASVESPCAANLLESVQGLRDRALAALNHADAHDQDIFASRAELDRMGGKTGFVRVHDNAASSARATSTAASSAPSSGGTPDLYPSFFPRGSASGISALLDAPSGLHPQQVCMDQASCLAEQFHPTMADDLRNFEAALSALEQGLAMEPQVMGPPGDLGNEYLSASGGSGIGRHPMGGGHHMAGSGTGMDGGAGGLAGMHSGLAMGDVPVGTYDGLQPGLSFSGGVPGVDATWHSFVEQLGF